MDVLHSPAPGVSAPLQARLGSQGASPAEGTFLAETARAAGVAPGWAGGPGFGQGPGCYSHAAFRPSCSTG